MIFYLCDYTGGTFCPFSYTLFMAASTLALREGCQSAKTLIGCFVPLRGAPMQSMLTDRVPLLGFVPASVRAAYLVDGTRARVRLTLTREEGNRISFVLTPAGDLETIKRRIKEAGRVPVMVVGVSYEVEVDESGVAVMREGGTTVESSSFLEFVLRAIHGELRTLAVKYGGDLAKMGELSVTTAKATVCAALKEHFEEMNKAGRLAVMVGAGTLEAVTFCVHCLAQQTSGKLALHLELNDDGRAAYLLPTDMSSAISTIERLTGSLVSDKTILLPATVPCTALAFPSTYLALNRAAMQRFVDEHKNVQYVRVLEQTFGRTGKPQGEA